MAGEPAYRRPIASTENQVEKQLALINGQQSGKKGRRKAQAHAQKRKRCRSRPHFLPLPPRAAGTRESRGMVTAHPGGRSAIPCSCRTRSVSEFEIGTRNGPVNSKYNNNGTTNTDKSACVRVPTNDTLLLFFGYGWAVSD